MNSVAPIETPAQKSILDFEALVAQLPGAQFGDDVGELKHSFAGPLYIREMRIPKGMLLTGRIHRHEHPFFLLAGDLTVFDEFDGGRRIKAPVYFVSKPGVKRIGFAHEDVLMVTVHYVGEERDLLKIEDMETAWTYEEYEKGLECPKTNCLPNG